MQCTQPSLSTQEAYLQKQALLTISYEMGKWCGNDLQVQNYVYAFNKDLKDMCELDTKPHALGDMPFTLSRYFQNQILVQSVMDNIENTEGNFAGAIHVALSVCCAMHVRLPFVNKIVPVKTNVTNALGMPSGVCTDGVQHELNTAMWYTTLNERAIEDATNIIHFTKNHTSSSPKVMLLVQAIEFIMISSGCLPPASLNLFTNQQKHTETITKYIMDFFVAEANARVLIHQDDESIAGEYHATTTPVDGTTVKPVDGTIIKSGVILTGIPVYDVKCIQVYDATATPVDRPTATPVDRLRVDRSLVPTVVARPMVSEPSSTAI